MNEKFPDQEDISPLEKFKKEVAVLKKQEEENLDESGNKKTAHFEEVNPDELNEADQKLYKKFLNGELTTKELRDYQAELRELGNRSQKDFAAYVANKLFIQMH